MMNPQFEGNPPLNPYLIYLDDVEKPARYIGGEKFIVKKQWTDQLSKVALAFPDTYEIGMSHLGFKILYDELNKSSNVLAERCFSPWIDMEEIMRKHSLPLVCFESYKTLSEFDIVGFSLQYEMTYTNILNMLDLGGISILQNERRENEPFVICGGPCATHPEPLADFMDIVVIGDGEDLFVRLADFIGKQRKKSVPRVEILAELSRWKGIYVPSLYSTEIDELSDLEVVKRPADEGLQFPIKRFFVESLKDYPIPTESPIPHMTAIFDRHSVELARGCTEGCRFCQAGMIYRPVRERRPNDIINSVIDGVVKGGFDEASLTCLSTADYSAITPLLVELLDKMKEQNATLGISSLRAYGLDNRIFDKMAEVKNTSLTFAPEAGSARMRNVINKNISEEDMMTTAKDVFSRGWSKMKLYFMIGLPTEEDEDVRGIMETAYKAKWVGKRNGVSNPNITVSASSFVPKPHTPFQWHAMIPLSEIERKQEMLWQMSRKFKLNFRKHLSKTSFFECFVARGDRRVGQVIYSSWKKGARFDGWNETFNFETWMEAVEESDLKIENYLGTIRVDARLPWDHIDVGLKAKFLEREWKKALKDRLSPPCGKPAGAIVHHSNLEDLEATHTEKKKKLVCYHCGVACDLEGMIDERKEYLTSLSATKSIPYVEPENLGEKRVLVRDKRGQNIGIRYRFEFSKVGSISFISHLDLQKIVARIFKRAQIETLYSEGHNRRPLIAFGPALSLGISSFCEFFDVRVSEKWERDDIIDLLNSSSERGIIFHNYREIGKKDPSIQDGTRQFEYFIPVLQSKDELEEKIEGLLNMDEIVVPSYSKSKNMNVDRNVRQFIESLKVDDFSISASLEEFVHEILPESENRKSGIQVKAKFIGGSTIRPREITSILEGTGLKVGKPIKTAVSVVQ